MRGSLRIDFKSQMHYPGTVDVGTCVLRLGNSSITIGEGLFKDGNVVATAESVIVFVDDARQATDQLAKGAYDLCLFNCSQEVFAARDQGLPVNVLQHVLKEGEDIGWGANVVWAMNKPPHPAAQKLFINFLLSREGQIMFQDITGSDSLRIDIPKDSVKLDLLRHPGVEYLRFDQLVPYWLTTEIKISGITFA